MLYLAGFTYTNKDFSNFFAFKHDPDLIALNLLINKVINKHLCQKEFREIFFNQINTSNLNQSQIKYVNDFLNTYSE